MSSEMTINELMAIVGEPNDKPFVPFLFHNEAGGCFEWVLKQSSYYGKWIDPLLTLYLDKDDDSLVGFELSDLDWMRKTVNRRESVKQIAVCRGKIRLRSLISIIAADSDKTGKHIGHYLRIIGAAEAAGLDEVPLFEDEKHQTL
jgi:hypothetical protein